MRDWTMQIAIIGRQYLNKFMTSPYYEILQRGCGLLRRPKEMGMLVRWRTHTIVLIIQANWIRIRMDYALSPHGKCSTRSQIPASVMSSGLNYSESQHRGHLSTSESVAKYGQSNYSHQCPKRIESRIAPSRGHHS